MKQFYLGVDPGVKGAVALLGPNDELHVWDIPVKQEKRGKRTVNKLDELVFLERVMDSAGRIVEGHRCASFIEKVASMEGQGRASIFSFGEVFGSIKMGLTAMGFEYTQVTPQKWKGAMRCSASKEHCFLRCMEEFGDEHRHLWLGSKLGILDGRCEAALIAAYGRKIDG